MARLNGRTLLEHAVAALTPHVARVVVCGRTETPDGLLALPDRPRAGLGPLGGLAAALRHAQTEGFDAVLTIACDTPVLPSAILSALFDHVPPAYAAEAPTIGLWPPHFADALERHLADDGERSIRRWAASVGAASVAPGVTAPNINRPEDLLDPGHRA